jgi:CRP-like cAMP-binding protein
MDKILKLNGREKAVLSKALIVSGLDPAQRDALLACAAMTYCEARDILFYECEKAQYFYCVLDGYVRLYRLGCDGRDADIRICEPGDSFAECLIQSGEMYHYSAQAMDHAVLARFDLGKVRELLDEQPRISKAIMRSLSQHLLSVMECVANDRMQTAPQRVAHYLLTHCVEEGSIACLRLPFQKSLLARKLGLAPEALSRAFSTLRQAGVTVRGRTIAIRDVNALRAI